MLRFAHIEFLWGLAGVPVLLLLFMWVTRWKKKALTRLGDKQVVNKMMPEVSFSRPWLKVILWLSAFVFLIIGLADPQLGSHTEEVKRKGADLMVLLDVSNSMLAEDIAPSRLENAKRALTQLVDNLHENDRIGLIVFAGQAYVQMPVTTDYSAAKLFLGTINTNMVPTQGTAIGDAINLGMRSFDFKNGTGKAMIIITDGENHEDDAVAAAKAAHDRQVMINVVGIGSQDGAPIPMLLPNGQRNGYHLDENGKEVITKMNEEACKEIAAAGGGVYTRATNANSGLGVVMQQVGKVQRKMYGSKSFKDFEDRFQYFIGLAFVLLAVEFFISARRNMRLSRIKLFEVENT